MRCAMRQRPGRPASGVSGPCAAFVKRLDADAVVGARDERLDGRALQHAPRRASANPRGSRPETRRPASDRPCPFLQHSPLRPPLSGAIPLLKGEVRILQGAAGDGSGPIGFDAAAVDGRRPVPHGPPLDQALGGDVEQRHEHEGALGEARMRDRQVRLVDALVAVGQDVDVDRCAGPSARAARGRGPPRRDR